MLDVRTNILLDKETYRLLATRAAEESTSIGHLIRIAIEKVYKKREREIIKRRTKVIKEIRELQKKIKPTRGIDYRELIEYGRYR